MGRRRLLTERSDSRYDLVSVVNQAERIDDPQLRAAAPEGTHTIAKRAFDLIAASLLLVLALPLIAVIAALIRALLGVPVLFTQQRPGLGARPFTLYKFRSMTDARESDGQLLPDELRLTRLGKLLRKLSLDELPQLWNVVRGDMSLVGPRPLLMEYLPLYSLEQARRHEVRPGVTGWTQVNGRNALTWEEKFALDIWYVDNRSFRLDLRIVGLTLLALVRPSGINQPGSATTSKFTGSARHDRA